MGPQEWGRMNGFILLSCGRVDRPRTQVDWEKLYSKYESVLRTPQIDGDVKVLRDEHLIWLESEAKRKPYSGGGGDKFIPAFQHTHHTHSLPSRGSEAELEAFCKDWKAMSTGIAVMDMPKYSDGDPWKKKYPPYTSLDPDMRRLVMYYREINQSSTLAAFTDAEVWSWLNDQLLAARVAKTTSMPNVHHWMDEWYERFKKQQIYDAIDGRGPTGSKTLKSINEQDNNKRSDHEVRNTSERESGLKRGQAIERQRQKSEVAVEKRLGGNAIGIGRRPVDIRVSAAKAAVLDQGDSHGKGESTVVTEWHRGHQAPLF